MTTIDISTAAIIFGTIAVLFVYIYIYMQYKEAFIGLWTLSWLVHLVKMIFMDMTQLGDNDILFQLLFQNLSICSSIFLLWGTNSFVNKGVKRLWINSILLSVILTNIALIIGQSFVYKFLLTCILIGSIYIWTGMVFLCHLHISGVGKYITGVAFIVMGLHAMDIPFLINIPWFAKWGYLLDASLRFIIAIGTLLVYFEKVRHDLSNKEKYYRLLTENAVDVIYRYQIIPKHSIEYISPAVTAITGYTPEEFYNDPDLISHIIHPKDLVIYKDVVEFLSSHDSTLTVRLLCKDNKEIWVEQKFTPIYGNDNQIIAIEGIIRDVTSRKILEQDISRLDRLNTVGQMAASVAHEIRNPMTTVRGYLQLLGNKKEFSNYSEQFGLLMDELDRTNSIISEYLSLSQNRLMDFKTCQLNQIIKSIHPLIQADANGTNKEIKLELTEIPDLYMDGKEIRQLMLNLVRNGLESMKSGKTLTIRTFLDKDEVILAIKDEGEGIPQHILKNLGKPFLTTKEGGTGIGLAICYRIANRHNANITVETNYSGTTFYVHFKTK